MMQRSKRHNVVLLFTDLSASTRLASQIEPEQYGEILEQLRLGLHRAVEKHGGEIIRIDGDGALCLFGYPVAYEDAGRRAVEAALDAHAFAGNIDLIRQLQGQSLDLHSGIHAGAVLLREGDILRGRYEVLGDATNVAARICDAASAGEVLVTGETLGRDRELFETGAVRMVNAAGHEAAIAALPVRSVRNPHDKRSDERLSLRSKLVGRSDERRTIRGWLASGDQGGFVTLHGPAGIGKSRLLAAFAEEARGGGWIVAQGGCEAYLGTRPLEPFLQIAKLLAPLIDQSAMTNEGAIRRIVEEAQRHRQTFLLLDDWQWADDKSRELLLSLIDQMRQGNAPKKLRILVASREPWTNDEAQQPDSSLALEPFFGADLDAAIRQFLPGCDAITAANVSSASGGMPLLLEEVCHAVAAGRVLDADTIQSTWYELAVQARVENLAQEDTNLLRLCAVVGQAIPKWILAAAWGSALDHAQLARLEEADFLKASETDDTLQFKHGMTRDAVYSGLGLKFRTDAHRKLAEIHRTSADNDDGGREAALALHLFASQQIEEALPFSLTAADKALEQGALDRAQFHCREAFNGVERLHPGARQIDALRHVIKTFGRATVVDPMRHHIGFFERLLKFAKSVGDAYAIALATYWIGSHNYGLGEPRRSLAWLKTAYEQVTELGASTFAVQIEANLGQSNAVAAKYTDALRYMDLAISSKLRGRDTSKPSTSLAYCLSSRGLVKADMGDFGGAIADFDASVAALVDMEHPILPSLETQRCLALIYFGRFEEAARRAEFSRQMSERTHARFLVFSSQVLGSYARFSQTSVPTHFDRFVEASLRLFSSGRLQRISYKFGWIAEVMVARGEVGQARLFATLALRRTLKGDRLGEAIAARALAKLSAQEEDHAATVRYLAMADRSARLRHSAREEALNLLCAGECHRMFGQEERAVEQIGQAADRFYDLNMTQFDRDTLLAS